MSPGVVIVLFKTSVGTIEGIPYLIATNLATVGNNARATAGAYLFGRATNA